MTAKTAKRKTKRRIVKKPADRPVPKRSDAYFDSDAAIRTFTSGCAMLDLALGGGWALNRMINIVGDKSTGKTLLAIEAAVNFLRKFPDGSVKYVEAESAFDGEYAEHLGLPYHGVEFPDEPPIDTVEDLYEYLRDLSKGRDTKSEPCLVIVDSMDALTDRAEVGREIDQGSYGANKAKQLSALFRRINKLVSRNGITLIIVSQVRDKIGVTFGKSTTRSGGRALDFYASQIPWLAHKKRLKRTRRKVERVYGVEIVAKIEKNKVGPPFRECEFPIVFNYGIENLTSMIDFLVGIGRAPKAYTLESLKKAKSSVDALDDEAYFELEKTLRVACKREWRAIEEEHAPKRRKYV